MTSVGWVITYGIEYSIGALAVLVTANKHPKVGNPVSLLLTVALFSYFFMVGFTEFFYMGERYGYSPARVNELKFYYAFELVTLPLILGLICFVLLSVGTHDAHHHRLIRLILGIGIGVSLVFFVAEDIK